VIRTLENEGIKVAPVCPEMLGGLPCLRPPVKTIKKRVLATDTEKTCTGDIGEELTETFERGAHKALRIAKEVGAKKACFMKMSPSCAPSGIAGRLYKQNGFQVIPIW
jgi:uncharacterized protein YbbK (DUF523 family)